MKLCGKCRRKPWPSAIAVFISTFVAFVTWLTLSVAGLRPDDKLWWTITAFLVSVVILFSYMISCMRRHCADDRHAH